MKVRLEHTTPDYLALELDEEDIIRLIRGLPAIGQKRAPCTGEIVSITRLGREIEMPYLETTGKFLDVMLPASYNAEEQIRHLDDKTFNIRTITGARTGRYATFYII